MKQLKILFVVPPNITFEAFTNPGNNTKSWSHSNGKKYGVLITDVPLGVLTLSAVVKKDFDADVRVIDFNTEIHKNWNYPDSIDFSPWFLDHYSNLVDDGFIPDIVAFSSLFITGYENVLLLANLTKDIFPNAFRICGGNLATTMYKEIYEDDPNAFNALCYGEGELSLVAMIKAKNYQEYCDSSENWITKSNLRSSGIYKHNFIDNLDNIPYLDYSCINISDYHFNPTIKAYTNIADKTNYLTYMGSRGCPFLCTFCSAHTVHGRKMRSFSIDRIKKELTQLKNNYDASTLVIEDDMFLWDNDWAKEILRIAQELELICFFPNALALYALDWEMLTELHRTGVRQLTLAVESGSARVLKELMRKPLKLSITKRVADDCRKLGIYTDCNIIIGMPGETKEDIEDTRKFLRGLSANWFRINVATPLAGSEMYINAKEKGQIVGDIRFAGYKKCVISTDHFLPDEIEKIAYDLNLEINFLYNQDVRLGNYKLAVETFLNVLLMRDDHALAMYMISFCHYQMGNLSESSSYLKDARNIVQKSEFWRIFFDKHHLINSDSYPFYELKLIHENSSKNIDDIHLISN